MRIFLPTLVVLASLAACGGGEEEPSQVYKTMGSVQCSGGGVPLATLQAQLATANVQVHSAACGTDGKVVSTVCGSPDGKIGIFEIPSSQAAAASAAGFMALSTLPGAKTVPCT